MTTLLIEHKCSQCGAPIVLEDTDRLFKCEYCRVKSYLVQDYFRYMLPNAAPENQELIFFPYWRFKGSLFSCIPYEIQHKYSDISQPAIESRYFPGSLGFRTQTLKLRFVSRETQGQFLPPALSFKKAVNMFEAYFNESLPKPVYHQAFIGEAISLIYAPFYADDKLYDAVLNNPISPSVSDNFDMLMASAKAPDWNIRFIPAICPRCGWDLTGKRDGVSLFCQNCNSIWHSGKKGLERLPFRRVPGEGVIYLPFWRIKADVSNVQLCSYADMVRVANLPKVVRAEWEERDFYFWTMAFKAPPETLLRLNSMMTIVQPPVKELIRDLPDTSLVWPATLPITEAVQQLKIILANFATYKKNFFPQLQDITIKPRKYLLVYVPFGETPHEFVNSEFKMTIHKNMLKFSENL